MIIKAFRYSEAHIKLIRPNALADVLLIFLIAYALSGGAISLSAVWLPVLLLASSLFFSNAINDIYDIEVDKANKLTGRPLVSGVLSVPAAWLIVTLWALICVAASVALGGNLLYIGLVLLACGLLYSHPLTRLSHRGFLGTATMALAYFVAPAWTGVEAAGQAWNSQAILFALAITLIGIARLLLKDYRDLEGDKLQGKRTPLGIYGAVVVRYLVMFFLPLGLIALCVMLSSGEVFTKLEILAIILAALASAATGILATKSSPTQINHPKSVTATFLLQRLALVFTLVAVLLS